MAWRSPMSAREALIFDVNDGMCVSEAAEEHGVTRSCAYKWVSRYNRFGLAGLEELSRRPELSPARTSQELVDELLRLKKKYPAFGPAKLVPMLDAVEILARERPIDAYVVQAPTIPRALIDHYVTGRNVRVVEHDNGEAVAAADVALSSSGTATLECAVLGTPVIVMYRLSQANYWLGKMVVTIPHFALINIVAGKKIVPELIQGHVNGQRIAAETRRLLEPANYARVVEELAAVRSKLGDAGAARRAAEAIMKVVER